ncbi:T9SS type A sorting domain-containing protein [Flammeovirga pectinis]|uniref:T9SS type A sorting domain-containing protein n=1 Tax=Flammeovirga pectinis TaxID=2494373 RepID=A0A3S9P958_9BACT|nr:Ig-like domain-containing protein [Flammeovirga pectinis]AZQ64745.1 T9SS type A sorting domain-containing protein [Flammeovirga pectinis]
MKKAYLFFWLIFISFTQLLYATELDEILEAEAATLTGTTETATGTYASGGTYLKLKQADPSGSLQLSISDVATDGNYKLEIFTFNGGNTTDADLTVNGVTSAITLAASNWAYEGTAKATILDVTLQAGIENIITLSSSTSTISVDNIVVRGVYNIYYVSADGNDSNSGSIDSPWKTLTKATEAVKTVAKGGLLNPGDKLLFRKGDTFEGQFVILCSGTESKPIEIGSYGTGELPIISGSGNIATGDFIEAIKMTNTSYITLDGIWVKNDRQNMGNITWGTNTSYGIKVIANKWGGISKGLTFRNLKITDVFGINMIDYQGLFTLDYYSAKGIFFDSDRDDITVTPTNEVGIDDVLIENCYFYNLGSTAISIRHLSNLASYNNPIDEEERNLNFVVRNNHFEKLGGDGVVLASVCNSIVEKNTFVDLGWGNHQSSTDRYFGRGEGCWIWDSRNVIVQYNKQLRARGFGDTYGSAGHIDFYCKNAIYQYNYSEDTEGGFVEILGDCVNSTFRYNVSKNDGFRDHHGYSIWVSGYVGSDKTPIRSDSNFVYNNTVLLNNSACKPDISIYAKNTFIYNNIFKVVDGAAIGADEVMIDIANGSDLVVSNNLFYGNVASGFTNLDNNKITGQDPLFVDESASDIEGFQLQEGSPAVDNGTAFPEPSFPMAGKGIFANISLHTATDIYGNAVDVKNLIPNIGADNNFNSQIHKDAIRTTGVTVAAAGGAIEAGETVQLTATVAPSNATYKTVTWSSSNTAVATVNSSTGLVTAVSNGNAAITATTEDGGFTSSANVTVGADVEVDLVINGGFENGLNSDWNTWNSPQETTDAYQGTTAITITEKGSANQWITVEQNSTYILSAYIKISNTAKRIVLGVNDADNNRIDSKDIYTGVYKLHEVEFETGSNTTVKVFSWLPPSDGATATIDNIKVVKKSAVYVPVATISVSAQNGALQAGGSISLAETIAPSNASDKSVTWSSDNSAVATVSNGVVTAVSAGTANITVQSVDSNLTASTVVTVSPSSIATFKNGDFEDGLNHWSIWQDIVTTTDGAYEGSSLRLNGVGSCNQTITVKANTSYIFSGYVKVDNPSSARVVMGVNDANSDGIAFKDITNEFYTYHEVAFETGNNETTITVYFWRPSGSSGYAYLDNAMLIEVPSSSARKTTTIELEEELTSVLVYPNPASDFVTFKTTKMEGLKSISILNIVGQSVVNTTFEEVLKLPVSTLQKGTYIVLISDEKGNRATSKLLIK